MASSNLRNLPSFAETARTHWPVVGARLHPDDKKRAMLAAIAADYKNLGEFVKTAIMEKTERVLGRRERLEAAPGRRSA